MPKQVRLASLWLVLIAGVAAAQSPKPALFVVHFETGPGWNQALTPEKQPAFGEHSANLARLRKEGAITFGARYEKYGMIFLHAESMDAAKAIIDADPGVKAGTFVYRIAPMSVFYPWKDPGTGAENASSVK